MSCCGDKPASVTEDATLRSMVNVLRTRRNALRSGDGFGYAGNLISAYKRTISRLEELIALVETAPAEEPAVGEKANPNCDGIGEHNVPGCECHLIWKKLVS